MATTTRELSSDKAQRIVDAMRESVGARGAAGATFDHVAREAGVSRGLLHYYFGTKERLLVEVCRRDRDIRLGQLDVALARAGSADELVDVLVRSLEHLVRNDPGAFALAFELFSTSRHNEDVAIELRRLNREVRDHLARRLEAKQDEGVIVLRAPAAVVAEVLFSLADGLALRMLADPGHDWSATLEAAVTGARPLIDAP